MSLESKIFMKSDLTSSSPNVLLSRENNDVNISQNNTTIMLNDQSLDDISRKSDESYFSQNFGDCMERLQLIEKEQELLEKEDTDIDIQFRVLQKDENKQTDKSESDTDSHNDISNHRSEFKNVENGLFDEKAHPHEIDLEQRPKSFEKMEKGKEENAMSAMEEDLCAKENKEPIPASWYSSLKKQFETKEQEKQEQTTKEMTCRITGATLKTQNENKKSEDKEKDTRHYFSRLVKTNKSLIDEELPDPDKVKHIRAMFQETLNSTLKRKLNKKLGGSLQNISIRTTEQQMSRPLSAQCYRKDLFCENQNQNLEKDKKTSKQLEDGIEEFPIENTKKKLLEKCEKDLKQGRDYRSGRILQSKWTDSGSVSSGISSDLSSYDTDFESYSREGTEQDEMTISDDDLPEEMKDKHYVQNEILEKIRSFGTSVTYYGGEMLTCSIGPLLSPTTQAIMEEIGEKYAQETNPARTFDEFYRKYVETNEPNRKKKLGRTRSFCQSDVFQKPNVLSNTEIEMYKNDLEIEIGIKKPTGIQQNSLKRKVTKSASLGSGAEVTDKIKENHSEPLILKSESNSPTSKKQISESTFEKTPSDIIKNNETSDSIEIKKPKSTMFPNESENQANLLKDKNIENKAETEESKKDVSEKEVLYLRSKSAPEGLSAAKNTTNEFEIVTNKTEHSGKEIFFSYEKSIFTEKRNPDMEFEEFEVCESLSEKLEKLEKINSIEKSTGTNKEGRLNVSSETEAGKPFENNNSTKKEIRVDLKSTTVEEHDAENESEKIDRELANNCSERKDLKHNYPRWPIQTTVVVDIQKNNEQTPKLITSGKTVAKTKIRFF